MRSDNQSRSDTKMLYALLTKGKLRDELLDLTDIAQKASRTHREGEEYKAIADAFCDGVEICLGYVNTVAVRCSSQMLKDHLNGVLRSFIVKNILVQSRGRQTCLWLTFNSETSRLDAWTMF